MAKLEHTLYGDFFETISRISDGILDGSMSATLEEFSNFSDGKSKCSVRVFERYSYFGNNRVSMSITFFQVEDGPIHMSAITSGGSQAMFFKINTVGEEAFLEKLKKLL